MSSLPTAPAPPPSSPSTTARPPFWRRLGLGDLLLFCGVLLVTVLGWAMRPIEQQPRSLLVLPAILVLMLREKIAPSRPRVPRPGTGALGVVLGLLLFLSLPVLLLGLILTAGSVAQAAPDWDVARREKVAEHSVQARTRLSTDGNFASVRLSPDQRAQVEREAEAEVATRREVWERERKDDILGTLKIAAVGALGLALALGVQRLRTVPATGQ